MRNLILACLTALFLAANAVAAPKPHIISFGKFSVVKWFVGTDETTAVDLKVRPLLVDARLKEYTLGGPHEITDRLFVVRRAFRVNDALPEEAASPRLWRWERGAWLLVDRVTGRITTVNLPEFDPYFSSISWYRDYAAYCGVSEDGKKLSVVVAQIGRRKPLLKKVVASAFEGEMPDSACSTPVWQRQPARVTFDAGKDQRFSFTVRGHALEVITDDEDAEPVE